MQEINFTQDGACTAKARTPDEPLPADTTIESRITVSP